MDEAPTSQSLADKVKQASLRFAGYGYLLGDASIVARGIATGNRATMLTGLAWGSGGLGLSIFGKKPASYQLKELAQGLSEHYEKHGIAIPQHSTLKKEFLADGNTFLNNIQKFCYDHPSEILNTIYAVGALSLMKGGYKEFKISKDYSDMASGALVLGGALGGLLIKEKKPELKEDGTPEKPKNLLAWIQEKPLRLTGALYSLNNLFPLMAAVKGHRAALKGTLPAADNYAYKLRYAQVGAFGTANALLGMSSKDGGHGGASADFPKADFLKHVEEVVTLQPIDKQAIAQELAADFIAGDPRFSMDKHQALAHLSKAVSGTDMPPVTRIQHAEPKGQLTALDTPVQRAGSW